MKIKILSKTKVPYFLEWYASIDDFERHLSTMESDYIRCTSYFSENTLLKISEIESISIIEED